MVLPTLDFALFLHGNQAERLFLGEALVTSFKNHGFAKLINHGLSEQAIDDLFKWSRKFFELPREEKQKIVNLPSDKPQRGWSYMGAETTAKLRPENIKNGSEGLTDEKEHFDVGPPTDTNFPNQWPSEAQLPSFRPFIEDCYLQCQEAALQVIAAMEIGFHMEPGQMVTRCQPAASELRLNYYPAVTLGKLREGKTKRGWPHSDFGIITLLFQDQVGGLEMEDRSTGTYVPVPPTPKGSKSEMVINISDTFQRWSNAVVTSGLHQVTVPQAMKDAVESGEDAAVVVPERFSNVFFFKASRDTSVGPHPHFVTKDRKAMYEEMTALQFHRHMTKVLY